jgi:ribosomal protein S18 acetylase RimI-like enzyme
MPGDSTIVSRRIRIFAPEDLPDVVGILTDSEPWRTLGYDPAGWGRYFETLPPREAWVLETAGRAVAVASVRRGFLYGDYVELLAVAGALRGRGIGSELLAHLESRAFASGWNLFACVSDFNNQARRFYAARGFAEVGSLAELLVPGSAEILLRKCRGPARSR